MNKPQQLLRDVNIRPTAQIIAHGLGKANLAYTKFLEDLKKYGISLMDWRYYNDGKSWLSKGEYKWTTTRGTNKVKPIFWLSIWDGFFKISFFFPEKIRAELLALPISLHAKEMIGDTLATGKTTKTISVIFDIADDCQLEDVYVLAEFRKKSV